MQDSSERYGLSSDPEKRLTVASPIAASRHETIASNLRRVITAGELVDGMVIYERVVADLYGTSRSPVKRALESLRLEGLLSRHRGRGYLVGANSDASPSRPTLTASMVGLPALSSPPAFQGSAERIGRDLESLLAEAYAFGRYRINEQGAAEYYGVSRTVIRELLSALQGRSLVRKNRRSHWTIGPLTAAEVANSYAIRARLEPLALLLSAPHLDRLTLMDAWNRICQYTLTPDALNADAYRQIETDLHDTLLARCENTALLSMIEQCQIPLIVNRLFARTIGSRCCEPALEEHRMVIAFLVRGAFEAASNALEAHLHMAAKRTRQRLKTLSVVPQPSTPAFLQAESVHK